MINHPLERGYENESERCQASFPSGQCVNKRQDGTEYCKIHQGAGKPNAQAEKMLRNYRLARWQGRVNDFASNPEIKSLREEIGIARMVLEATLDRCQDANDLFLYSTKISDHIVKIEKVVASCHRLEQSTAVLLDKSTVLQMSSTIVEIIGKYVTDGDVLDKIGNEIIDAILNTQINKETAK